MNPLLCQLSYAAVVAAGGLGIRVGRAQGYTGFTVEGKRGSGVGRGIVEGTARSLRNSFGATPGRG